MSQYTIEFANTYQYANSPLKLEVGEHLTTSGYSYIEKLPNDDFSILALKPIDNISITNNIIQVALAGSYTVAVYPISANIQPVVFSFCAFDPLLLVTQKNILNTINEYLPSIYNPQQILNLADNTANAACLAIIYEELDIAFFNVISSVGSGTGYNQSWEYVYLKFNKYLQNAVYPAALIQTLMQIPTLTSVKIPDVAICLSKIFYQFSGNICGVQIVYDNQAEQYNINLYADNLQGWVLGLIGNTELGDTTILGGSELEPFLWIMYVVAYRLMPSFCKYYLNYFNQTLFKLNFNVDDVLAEWYYDPAINYDAYEAVNNNNNFNIKGYNLKPT